MTKLRQYQQGYCDALIDILRQLEEDGEEGVREWVKNNLHRDHVYGA